MSRRSTETPCRRLALMALFIATITSLNSCASLPQACRALNPDLPIEAQELTYLTCQAEQGNQPAQLALGKRYESGNGVKINYRRAAELYKMAAKVIPEHTAIYSPPVKVGGSGQVNFYDNPNATRGLPEAQYRLGIMYREGRGVSVNEEAAERLIEQAKINGYPNR